MSPIDEDSQAELLRALGAVRTEMSALRKQASKLVPREEMEDRSRRLKRNLIVIGVLAIIGSIPLIFLLSESKSTGDAAKSASTRLTQDQYDRAISGYSQCQQRNAQLRFTIDTIRDLYEAEQESPPSADRDVRLRTFKRFLDSADHAKVDCNIFIVQAQNLERAGAKPAPNFPPVAPPSSAGSPTVQR